MKIILNGKIQEFQTSESQVTLDQFLKLYSYKSEYVAVAVNLNFIPKSHYSSCYLCDNDDVEILTPMQGG